MQWSQRKGTTDQIRRSEDRFDQIQSLMGPKLAICGRKLPSAIKTNDYISTSSSNSTSIVMAFSFHIVSSRTMIKSSSTTLIWSQGRNASNEAVFDVQARNCWYSDLTLVKALMSALLASFSARRIPLLAKK